jgi:hypothetical protein
VAICIHFPKATLGSGTSGFYNRLCFKTLLHYFSQMAEAFASSLQCPSIPVAPHPWQHLLSSLFNFSHSRRYIVAAHCSFNLGFLMATDAENLSSHQWCWSTVSSKEEKIPLTPPQLSVLCTSPHHMLPFSPYINVWVPKCSLSFLSEVFLQFSL